jgi:CheY-like chemotaxis protein
MSPGDEETESEPVRVLVVDDEPDVADAYAVWLDDGYEVLTATGGEQALELVDHSVDVVLLDRRMPGLSGDEVLERLAERELDPRVAMVTAVDPDFDILEMPFDTYLTKPVTSEDLRTTVDRLVSVTDYDARSRELFALAEKRAALETGKTAAELEDSDAYAELTDRIETLRASLTEEIADADQETMEMLFREFSAGPND